MIFDAHSKVEAEPAHDNKGNQNGYGIIHIAWGDFVILNTQQAQQTAKKDYHWPEVDQMFLDVFEEGKSGLIVSVDDEEDQKGDLEGKVEIEETPEVDNEVLGAHIESSRIDGGLWVASRGKDICKLVRYEPEIEVTVADQHIIKIELKGQFSHFAQSNDLYHLDQAHALMFEFKFSQPEDSSQQ